MEVIRNNNGYIYSNGSLILEVSDTLFSIREREFVLSTKVPFSTGDKVAFKLRLDNGIGYLEEFHIWKSASHLYIKAFISLFPMGVVVLLFFRKYRFDAYRWIFVRKAR